MNRREALKSIGLLSGGIMLFPSCDFSEEHVARIMNKLKITAAQEKTLNELVSALIPEGEIPGAGSLKVSSFVWVMLDDCSDSEKQASFMKGIDLFPQKIKIHSGKFFQSLNQNEKEDAIKEILNLGISENKNSATLKNIKSFINTTKNYTIWGYMQSEYIMTEIMPYKLVPGSYGLCETDDINERINVNA